MRKIKMVLAAAVIAFVGVFGAMTPVAHAKDEKTTTSGNQCPPDSARKTWDSSIAECNMPVEHKNDNLFNTIQTVINVILALLGIIAVVMIILGGINFITSQGDPTKTKKGRDTILYGIIGLVVALLAYAIVNFVLTNIFGKNSSNSSSDDKKAVTTTIVQKKD